MTRARGIERELARLACDARAVGPAAAIVVLEAEPDRVRLADALQAVELPAADALALLAELPDAAGPGAVWLALGMV